VEFARLYGEGFDVKA
jgi:ATP-dependent NAD(P)H-hydrate dehydratase